MFSYTASFRNPFGVVYKLKKKIKIFLLLFLIIFVPNLVFAEIKNFKTTPNNINTLIKEEIKDPFYYSGLAAFYNGVTTYIVSEHEIERLNDVPFYNITPRQSLAIIGHHKVMIVSNINAALSFKENKLIWQEGEAGNQKFNENNLEVQLLLKSDLVHFTKPFQQLKYVHLWEPFRLLCIGIEAILLFLNSLHFFGWGITIILLSLLFKIFILPVNIFLIRSQRKASYIQASLAPELEDIKSNFFGEEAHNKFMAAHKAKGVTPFYNLRPLFLTLVPIPFLIAIFNVLGELDFISGHSFLWIKDLAYPDAIFHFGAYIPLLGSSINPLPILMTLLTIFVALLHQNKIVSAKELRNMKLNLYFIAFGIFLLFYSFPSAMVLYWTFATIWQLIQQKFIRI
ncbi:MAG: membrane protein insertase YidC [Pelagibacterales bacterium]|nr:membrane protein insertase YidC [Pelagibacterales bacterium]